MEPFKNFIEFYEAKVKLLALQKQKRLDGRAAGSSPKEFARFRHQYKTWKVNEDTHIEPLRQAYLTMSKGEEPFVITRTEKGTDRLALKADSPAAAERLYIYRVGF